MPWALLPLWLLAMFDAKPVHPAAFTVSGRPLSKQIEDLVHRRVADILAPLAKLDEESTVGELRAVLREVSERMSTAVAAIPPKGNN